MPNSTGVRSSRRLERRWQEGVAFRVLSANTTPDHVTFARLRVRHEQALAGLLVASLSCAPQGWCGWAWSAWTAPRSRPTPPPRPTAQTPSSPKVAELLAQAAAADRADDHEQGEARKQALPRALAARTERLERLHGRMAPALRHHNLLKL
jgi:Transposase domain (DUF772)